MPNSNARTMDNARAMENARRLRRELKIDPTGMTADNINALLERSITDQYENQARDRDRANSLADFRAQLADLTGSKQRQAEQAGRIAQANVRAQGLSQMMSNF